MKGTMQRTTEKKNQEKQKYGEIFRYIEKQSGINTKSKTRKAKPNVRKIK